MWKLESRKYNKLIKITEKEQTHRYTEQTSGEGEERGRPATCPGGWGWAQSDGHTRGASRGTGELPKTPLAL